jgi:hypothetical protein
MAAYHAGKMILFVCSILWDFGIPQEVATILYKDNDACTGMGNAQKPTPRTCHIDIKYFCFCGWVEHVLMLLEQIDTKINLSDHFTKCFSQTKFHRQRTLANMRHCNHAPLQPPPPCNRAPLQQHVPSLFCIVQMIFLL